jgi:hypothetical protein
MSPHYTTPKCELNYGHERHELKSLRDENEKLKKENKYYQNIIYYQSIAWSLIVLSLVILCGKMQYYH